MTKPQHHPDATTTPFLPQTPSSSFSSSSSGKYGPSWGCEYNFEDYLWDQLVAWCVYNNKPFSIAQTKTSTLKHNWLQWMCWCTLLITSEREKNRRQGDPIAASHLYKIYSISSHTWLRPKPRKHEYTSRDLVWEHYMAHNINKLTNKSTHIYIYI